MSKESIKPIQTGREKQKIERGFASNARKEKERLEEIDELLADKNSGVVAKEVFDKDGNKIGVQVTNKDGHIMQYEDLKANRKFFEENKKISEKTNEYLINREESGTAKPRTHTEQIHNNPLDHLPPPIKKPHQIPEDLLKEYPEIKDPFNEEGSENKV